ncbi:MAG: pcaD [Nocardioidaceae bacterium]|nr:pcaD [Nocardioidaceae bacterium]
MPPVALHHVDSGPSHAPPVVLLASLGATHRMWDELVANLAVDHHVVAPDARGHGSSPGAVAGVTVADLASDVLALANRLGLERFHLVGLSLGGAIAQRFTLDHPDRVASLTLACTTSQFGDPATWQERAAAVRADGLGPLREATGQRWFTPLLQASSPARVAEILDTLVRTDPEAYAVCCEALAAFDVRAEIGDLAVPTHVIGGAQDPTCPPEVTDELRAAIPGADRTLIEGAAHLANVCRPDAFAAAVRLHLAAHPVG